MEVNISRDELAGIYDSLVVPVLLEMFAAEPEGPAGESEPAAAESPTRIAESHAKIEQDISHGVRLIRPRRGSYWDDRGSAGHPGQAEASIGSQSCIAGEPG